MYTRLKTIIRITPYVSDIKYLVIFILIMKLLVDGKYTKRSLFGIATVLVCAYVDYRVQDTYIYLVVVAFLVYSAHNVKFRDILKVTLVIQVLILMATLFGVSNGLIRADEWADAERVRQDFGFIYCTFPSHLMLFISMIYCCLRRRISFIEMVTLLVCNYLLYTKTVTRTDMYLIVPFLIAAYVWPWFSKGVKANFITKGLFQYSSLLLGGLMIALQAFYVQGNVYWDKLNEWLSTRLVLGHQALETYAILPFGQPIKWIGIGGIKKNPMLVYNYVDCSFLKYLLNYGFVVMVILMLGLIWMGGKAIREQDQMLCLSFLFLYGFAMIDAELCVIAFHPFLFAMSDYFQVPEEGERDETTSDSY